MKKLDINKILLVLATLATLGPDVAAVATWLAGIGAWAVPVAHGLGLLAAACAGLAVALPRLRGLLSTLGLATAPGTLAASVPVMPNPVHVEEATTVPITPPKLPPAA